MVMYGLFVFVSTAKNSHKSFTDGFAWMRHSVLWYFGKANMSRKESKLSGVVERFQEHTEDTFARPHPDWKRDTVFGDCTVPTHCICFPAFSITNEYSCLCYGRITIRHLYTSSYVRSSKDRLSSQNLRISSLAQITH